MTLYERLLKIEHRAAMAWLVVVAITHKAAGVASRMWMVLAVSIPALAGGGLARTALPLAFARAARGPWRGRLFVPAALLAGVLVAMSNLPLMARVWLSETALKDGRGGLF